MSSARQPAIVLDRVWKRFRRAQKDSLRDLLPTMAKSLVATRAEKKSEAEARHFWALRDISFEVRPGDTLGIIGSNGAGKSTVLKLLTKLLRPTRGRAEVRGRVGALIEVASGFHGDLTGRENIYLQGAILGMRRPEIDRKFDQIVEFSGVSEFLDMQVKRYSSGMNARLGFSVAAHFDPDVLLIDEVLAVGDFAFQRRADERLKELAKREIPMVIVSHQLERVSELCRQAVLLRGGSVVRTGSPTECIAAYMETDFLTVSEAGEASIFLTSVTASPNDIVRSGERVTLTVRGRAAMNGSAVSVGVRVKALRSNEVVFASGSTGAQVQLPRTGPIALEVDLQMNVRHGLYTVQTFVWDDERAVVTANGPSALLRVERGPITAGLVQMNPRMRLLPVE